MGLAKGIWMMDVHTHAQVGLAQDNSDMELYHMQKYGVDMCVIQPTITKSNALNGEIAKRHPDKFIATCNDIITQNKSLNGEAKWTAEAAAKEIDDLLQTGLYKGIGEGIPRDRARKKLISWDERLDQICVFFEMARKYKFPIQWHTGLPIGSVWYDLARSRAHDEVFDNGNPLLAHEVASLYPDVPIIFLHGGIEASGYYMEDYERILYVAASHKNVFVATGSWWTELYEKPLKDPNIGAKKLVWGCAWGQNNQQQSWMPGCVPETAPVTQMDSFRNPTTGGGGGAGGGLQVDIWGWSLRELGKLNIPQDDLNLILGGNAAWLYGAKLPFSYERMFKSVDRGFDYTCMKTILD
jgi:predicted TIM-barrel fold metal-dependent hydrolase